MATVRSTHREGGAQCNCTGSGPAGDRGHAAASSLSI
jgi:hypothetical protein